MNKFKLLAMTFALFTSISVLSYSSMNRKIEAIQEEVATIFEDSYKENKNNNIAYFQPTYFSSDFALTKKEKRLETLASKCDFYERFKNNRLEKSEFDLDTFFANMNDSTLAIEDGFFFLKSNQNKLKNLDLTKINETFSRVEIIDCDVRKSLFTHNRGFLRKNSVTFIGIHLDRPTCRKIYEAFTSFCHSQIMSTIGLIGAIRAIKILKLKIYASTFGPLIQSVLSKFSAFVSTLFGPIGPVVLGILAIFSLIAGSILASAVYSGGSHKGLKMGFEWRGWLDFKPVFDLI